MVEKTIWEILPDWLSAFGTVMAVIVALFQKPLRNWLNRPKIRFTVSNNKQCVVELENSTENSDTGKEILIRMKLLNEGNYAALHSTLCVDTYYKRRGDGDFLRTEITPRLIKDFKKSKPTNIVPNYLTIDT